MITLLGLGCGLQSFPAPGLATSDTAPPIDEDVPGPFVIEARAPSEDAWTPLDGRPIGAEGVVVQLGTTDPARFDSLTEVVWLLGTDIARDRDGPPWSPHPDGTTWSLDPGAYRLCAHAWASDGLHERCAAFEVQGD